LACLSGAPPHTFTVDAVTKEESEDMLHITAEITGCLRSIRYRAYCQSGMECQYDPRESQISMLSTSFSLKERTTERVTSYVLGIVCGSHSLREIKGLYFKFTRKLGEQY
jgi:hypothetical protein